VATDVAQKDVLVDYLLLYSTRAEYVKSFLVLACPG
jgi:hypothetical protein